MADILDGCEFRYVGDLNDGAPLTLATHLKFRVGLSRKAGGLSHQTAAFYLAAARRFVWWLTVKKKAPVPVGLFDSIPGFDPDNHRKHARRNVSADDLARILEAARSGPDAEGLTGEARYFLYLAAFATGFRAAELASLKPEDFILDTGTPTVRLAGAVAKNRKTATQPLPPVLCYSSPGSSRASQQVNRCGRASGRCTRLGCCGWTSRRRTSRTPSRG